METPAISKLRRFAHQDIFRDAVRGAARLSGLVRPVGPDFVTLFPEAADGIRWLDDIQVLGSFDGRYRPVPQGLHHLAVLLS